LVDRIVPGKPPLAMQAKMEAENGYIDELMTMSEAYHLWAIESDQEKVHEVLSFRKTDPGLIITPDIDLFRELKLRLLNGSHTFSCGLAFLSGFDTVKEAMDNADFAAWISRLMIHEIAPAITNENISIDAAREFAGKVLDRFCNPHMEHRWLSITLQYSSKMKMRNIPVIQNYLHRFDDVPEFMSLGIAAHLLFMKCEQDADGKFYGERNGTKYPVNDDHAGWYAEKWSKAGNPSQLVVDVLGNEAFWGTGSLHAPEFVKAITSKLQEMLQSGALPVLKMISQQTKPVELS
jgi:tagaturonate reductase